MSSGAGKRGKSTAAQVKPSKGKIVQELSKRIENLEMGLRVSQMLVRQLMENIQPIQKDIGELSMQQRDLQYRALAFQELTSLDAEKVRDLSTELQIKDFTEISDKEDVEKNWTLTDVVTEECAVILTSTTPKETEDKGILRSKLLLAEIQFPDLREVLLGKKVGDVFDQTLNNVEHNIKVVGIRLVPVPVVEEQPEVISQMTAQVETENVEVH